MQTCSNNDLLVKIKDGDKNALEELMKNNMGLIKNIALRFRDRGVEFEDLLQIGSIGMLKAAQSFDFSFNTAFSTYAVPLIIGEIRRHLRDDGIVKVSRSLKKQGVHILKQKEAYIAKHGREPHLSELAELCSMSQEELVYALESVSPVHSLTESINADDESMTLESVIADKSNEIDRLTDRIALSEAIKTLPKIQQQIIHLRYTKELSQQQTGKLLGLSQVKISREEKKIIEYLRQAL